LKYDVFEVSINLIVFQKKQQYGGTISYSSKDVASVEGEDGENRKNEGAK
jgi:hypothetical protein